MLSIGELSGYGDRKGPGYPPVMPRKESHATTSGKAQGFEEALRKAMLGQK